MWSLFIYVSSMNTMFAGYITKNVICTGCYKAVETVYGHVTMPIAKQTAAQSIFTR